MASTYLYAEVLSLRALLSGRYQFGLPWFQRAYAWTDMQAGRLLRDLIVASKERQFYVLGKIFLAAPPEAPRVGLIDGHQRLVTLTIAFALLRDMIAESAIRQAADATIATRQATGSIERIAPQPGVSEFFLTFIQQPGGTQIEPDGDIMHLTESERGILANRNHLRQLLADELPRSAERESLLAYMLDRCLVTVESVADEEDAWNIVSTEEETHVEFNSSERSKVTLISGMPRQEQEEAGRIYDRCQSLLGPEDMCRLLQHIRTISLRKRSAKPIEKELMQRFSLDRMGPAFLRTELTPRAELMARIKRRKIADGPTGQALGLRLETLSWLDNQFWMPALLYWLERTPPEHLATRRFIDLVDRLAWIMKIAGIDPIEQEQRFHRLLGEIDRSVAPDEMKELRIEPKLLQQAVACLRARTFYAKRYSGLVLRRVYFNIDPAADRGPVDGDEVTMEHVLPRKPLPGSAWWSSFTTPEMVGEHVNRLGNLLLLRLEENQSAGRNDWPVKRAVVLESKFEVSRTFARQNELWNSKTIDARTEQMIAVLLTPWQLATIVGRAA